MPVNALEELRRITQSRRITHTQSGAVALRCRVQQAAASIQASSLVGAADAAGRFPKKITHGFLH